MGYNSNSTQKENLFQPTARKVFGISSVNIKFSDKSIPYRSIKEIIEPFNSKLLLIPAISGSPCYHTSLRKKCPYSELFWFVFSRIRTEYGEIRSISPYSVKIQKIQTRITPNTNTVHAVLLEKLNEFCWKLMNNGKDEIVFFYQSNLMSHLVPSIIVFPNITLKEKLLG